MAVVQAAVERKVPLLGICRGMQVMNVALGGSLHQDTPRGTAIQVRHTRGNDGLETLHSVALDGSSILKSIFAGDERIVNSSHHQSVDRLGEGLRVQARAEDGVVEAVGLRGNDRVLGVQWHPERILDRTAQAQLARWFVGLC